MATNTTQLTTVFGSFTDPILLAEEDAKGAGDVRTTTVNDKAMFPVEEVTNSMASVSDITNDVDPFTPKATDQTSVSSAPAALIAAPGIDGATPVAPATSKRQTGVSMMNE